MNKLLKFGVLVMTSFVLFSCGGKEKKNENTATGEPKQLTEAELIEKGDKLFRGKGNCTSCHLADKKLIGPSIKEIVKGYDAAGADLDAFLRGKSEAIIDPIQFSMMEPNLTITKRFSDTEMKAIIAYMRSL
ncbi:c-type cytochrome [Myroides pelagicus]|uniref:C-type cytochrome n=1 Tax=Myroides pelagicus TaxID=270914 RepID=A0A7K1GR23_9FLAO|nr:c-type cytochrome [Myroides pelagicus]MEC4112682.1 c-type cytochrome [Myroides pelagicus]MTH30919.1 c-type cytochrome [Myroides pelagicus]